MTDSKRGKKEVTVLELRKTTVTSKIKVRKTTLAKKQKKLQKMFVDEWGPAMQEAAHGGDYAIDIEEEEIPEGTDLDVVVEFFRSKNFQAKIVTAPRGGFAGSGEYRKGCVSWAKSKPK